MAEPLPRRRRVHAAPGQRTPAPTRNGPCPLCRTSPWSAPIREPHRVLRTEMARAHGTACSRPRRVVAGGSRRRSHLSPCRLASRYCVGDGPIAPIRAQSLRARRSLPYRSLAETLRADQRVPRAEPRGVGVVPRADLGVASARAPDDPALPAPRYAPAGGSEAFRAVPLAGPRGSPRPRHRERAAAGRRPPRSAGPESCGVALAFNAGAPEVSFYRQAPTA